MHSSGQKLLGGCGMLLWQVGVGPEGFEEAKSPSRLECPLDRWLKGWISWIYLHNDDCFILVHLITVH